MREISLDRLRTLVSIADNGSFAEAARLLHLAPPTVSLHIAELEARMGAPLLSRKRGQVRPTAIGEALIGRARRLLNWSLLLQIALQAIEIVLPQLAIAADPLVDLAQSLRFEPIDALAARAPFGNHLRRVQYLEMLGD